ncbi:MAG: hypothetical protein IH897_11255 [Planctomycetes bacterium]|nr:hypothetical protein [Planctomycetota bacterium]
MVDKVESCRDKQYLLFLKELSDETTCWIYFCNLARRFLHGRAADRADRVCRQQVLLQVLKGGRPDGIQVQARLHQAMLQDCLGQVQARLHEAMLQEGVVVSLSTLDV